MKTLYRFLLLISMSVFMNSCVYDAYPQGETEIPDVVSYSTDVMPLWGQCVGCHNGSVPPDLRDENSYNSLLNGYVVPGNADASILFKSLHGVDGVSLMPPGSQWPQDKIDLVEAWIEQGALDN